MSNASSLALFRLPILPMIGSFLADFSNPWKKGLAVALIAFAFASPAGSQVFLDASSFESSGTFESSETWELYAGSSAVYLTRLGQGTPEYSAELYDNKWVFVFDRLELSELGTITVQRLDYDILLPIVFLSKSDLIIAGTINASGGDGQSDRTPGWAGPGSGHGGTGGMGMYAWSGVNGDGDGGGAGGIFEEGVLAQGGCGGGFGGAGGGGENNLSSGGVSYGDLSVALAGGSGGGGGAGYSYYDEFEDEVYWYDGGGGGGGGAALQLGAMGNVEISGSIIVAGGTGGHSSGGGGGGGGSGGALLVHGGSVSIMESGYIEACGGSGGDGYATSGGQGGGGGGGQASFFYKDSGTYLGYVTVDGGYGYNSGSEGTFVFSQDDSVPSGGSGFAGEITPARGPLSGGNSVTISGVTLGSGSDITNVLVGGVAASIAGQGTDWVTILVPASDTPGPKDIQVVSDTVGTTEITGGYIYNPAGWIWDVIPINNKQLGAGYSCSFGIKNDGTIQRWGGGTTPPSHSDYRAISVYGDYAAALRSDGSLVQWGQDLWGDGVANIPAPNSDFVDVAQGGHYVLGLKSDGTIVAWGNDFAGANSIPAPNADFIAVAASEGLSLGLKSNGTVVAWGGNDYGQRDVPEPNENFVSISASSDYALGLKGDGSIVAWGNNFYGQCDVPEPNEGFVAVAAGSMHALGLKADGTIVGWGDNEYANQLVLPNPNENFVAIAASGYHSIAMRKDGTVVSWGYDSNGQGSTPWPNDNFGLFTSGVTPTSAVAGTELTIRGMYMGNGTDVTNVTIGGVDVSAILYQSPTRLLVVAGEGAPTSSDIVIYSTSFGAITGTNSFTYIITDVPVMAVKGTDDVEIADGAGSSEQSGTAFGATLVGGSTQRTFTIENTGDATLVIDSHSSTDSRFTVTQIPSSVPAGSSASLTIAFEPDAAGLVSAELSIYSNDAESPFVLNLSGFGWQSSSSSGPGSGGNEITISYPGLGNGTDITNVLVGGVSAAVAGQTADSVTFIVPAPSGSGGTVDIVVQSESVGETTIEDAYTYNPVGVIYKNAVQGWTEVEGMPVERGLSASAVMGDYLYVAGGKDDATWTDTTNVYRFDGWTWSEVAGMPDGCSEAVGVSSGDRMYVMGGWLNQMGKTNVYCFDGMSWTEVSGLPFPRTAFGSASFNDTIHIVGGVNGNFFSSSPMVHTFDGQDWTEIASLPMALTSPFMGVMNGSLYAAGGQDFAIYTNVYRLDGGAWTEVAGLPVPRAQNVGAVLEDQLYVVGGWQECVTNTAYRFDGTTWTQIESLPEERANAAVGVLDGFLYVAGGYSAAGVARSNVYRYATSTSTGVWPDSGSAAGGYPVTIWGENLGDGSDVTNVSICGIEVASIESQSPTQIVVIASSGDAGRGDVVVYSTSVGEIRARKAFLYEGVVAPDCGVLGADGNPIVSGAAGSLASGTDFGAIALGCVVTNTLAITNSGTAVLTISQVSVVGDSNFSVVEAPSTLEAGESADLKIVFEADASAVFSAQVEIESDDPDSPFVLNLTGAGWQASAGSGPGAGGNEMTISYPGLGNGTDITNVLVGGVSATVIGQTAGSVTFIVPAPGGSGGTVDIVVQSESAGETLFPNAYTYNPLGFIHDNLAQGWSQVSNLPVAVNGAASVTWNGEWYLIGGQSRTNVQVYNGRSWRQVAGLPADRSGGSAIVVDGQILFGGGANAGGYVTNCYRFDGSAWTEVVGLPRQLVGFGFASLDGALYSVAGQLYGTYYTNVFRLDGSEWTQVAGLPAARSTLSVLTLDDAIYAVGGDGSGGAATNVYRFDGTNWTEAAGLPAPRSSIAAGGVVLDANIYVACGYGASSPTNSLFRFDGASWEQLEDVPASRSQAAVGALQGNVYVAGGFDGTATNTVYRYVPSGRYGVSPVDGSAVGGFEVAILGENLGNGDITNVTICGVSVSSIVSQSATQVVVVAGAGEQGLGDVRVFSVSQGETVKADVFTYTKLDQTITFPEIDPQNRAGTLSLSATASSALPVSFSVLSGPASIDGSSVTFSDVGTVQIVASQAGDATYNAAPNVTNEFTVYATSVGSGPAAGGNEMTLSYPGLGNGSDITNVLVGGVSAAVVGQTADSVTIVVPAPSGSGGTVDIVVQSESVGDTTIEDAYTYNPAGRIRMPISSGLVDAGWGHSLALKEDGSILAWGNNIWGQGNVPTGTGHRFVSAGSMNSAAIGGDGNVTMRGYDPVNTVPAPNSDFVQVAVGNLHALGLKSDGTIVAWGDSDWNQFPTETNGFVAVSAGGYSGSTFISLGLRSDGSIAGWGSNARGQLNFPVPNTDFIAITAGGEHCLGLKSDGSIVGWGTSDFGILDVPAPNTNFVAVAAGQAFSMGLKADGSIVGWGQGFDGMQLPPTNSGFVAIAAFYAHYIALRADGSLWLSGVVNDDGQANLPSPNTGFGIFAEEVSPSSGSMNGGYKITIMGENLGNGSDVTNVTICGASAAIESQSPIRIVVTAPAGTLGAGDVAVYSTSFGETRATNAFTYLDAVLEVAGVDGGAVTSGESASVSRGTDFGAVEFGGVVTNTLVITNSGNIALDISNVSLGGGMNFSIVEEPSFLQPGEAGNLTIVFDAAEHGACSAQVEIESNDPASPFVLNLAGFAWGLTSDIGPGAGGNEMTVSYPGLGDGSNITNVLVGGVSAAIVGQTADSVTFILPSLPGGGTVDIVVQSESEGDTLFEDAYTYNPVGFIHHNIEAGWNYRMLMPREFMNGASVVYKDLWYVFTGNDSTNAYSFDGYDWMGVPGLPVVLEGARGAVLGDYAYVIGGLNGGVLQTNVYRFDGEGWTEVAGMPSARANGVAVTYNNAIYYVAGEGAAGATANVYRFDGSSWTEVASLPEDRSLFGAGVLNGMLYVVNGLDANGSRTNTVFRFDGVEWVQDASSDKPFYATSCATLEDKLYLVAGMVGPGGFEVEMQQFDGTNWSTYSYLPVGRGYPLVASFQDSIYLGGGQEQGSYTSLQVYSFAPYARSGVSPESASITGGTAVAIYGVNLGNGSDITNVTLCGVSVREIVSQSDTEIQVITEQAVPGRGDVRVYSESFGETVKTKGFLYTGPLLEVFSETGVPIDSGESSSFEKGTDFGLRRAGGVWRQTIVLSNAGNDRLDLSQFQLTGADSTNFQVGSTPYILEGEQAEVLITFAPDSVRDYSAQLTIESNDRFSPYVINLAGSALEFSVGAGPSVGGTTVTITGYQLGNGLDITNVIVDGVAATIVGQDAGSVTIVVPSPAEGPGAADILVQSSSEGDVLISEGYTYNYPGSIGGGGTAPKSIAGGMPHSLAIKEDGSIVVWGSSVFLVVPDRNEDFIAVSAGMNSAGLRSDGSIWLFGEDMPEPQPNEGFVDISSGEDFVLALKSDGSIQVFGDQWYSSVPQPNSDFVSIAGGAYHCLGLKSDGSIVAWGENNSGECDVPEPNEDFVAISAGGSFSVGLKSDGSVVMWGALGEAELPTPNSGFVAISAGYYHCLGLKSDGSVDVWGMDVVGAGVLDLPDPNMGFVAVSAGAAHNLALRADGTIEAWGWNQYGQLDIPDPNSGFLATSGSSPVSPSSGSIEGGYQVTINGNNLGNGSDVTNVTICGVPVRSIDSQSSSKIVVTVEATDTPGIGNVVIHSTSYGVTIGENMFTYTSDPELAVLGVDGAAIANNSASSVGSGTDCGSVRAGDAVSRTFTLTNSGLATLTIASTAITGDSEFEIVECPSSLEPGESGNLIISFSSQTPGSFAASLEIATDDPASPFVLNLAGFAWGLSSGIGPGAGGGEMTISYPGLGNGSDITNVLVGGVSATVVTQTADSVTFILPALPGGGTVDIAVQSASEGETLFEDAYTYNPAGSIGGGIPTEWAGAASAPVSVYGAGGAVAGGVFYMAGGWDPSQNDLFIYDGTNWTTGPELPVAAPGNPGGGALNDSFYLLGGFDNVTPLDSVHMFNGTSWIAAPSLPEAVGEPFVATLGSNLYVVGGSGSDGVSSNVYRFDGAQWVGIADLPASRSGMGGGVLGESMYAVGGLDGDGVIQTNVYRFDGTQWTEAPPLPVPLSYMASAVHDGYLYVMGGMDGSYAYTDVVFRFDGTTWEQMPSLPYTVASAVGFTMNDAVHLAAGASDVNIYSNLLYLASSGISPKSGSVVGGFDVTIIGLNLGNGTDITNVTLCGVSATTIVSQSSTQVVVTAGAGSPGVGDVVIYSTSFGETRAVGAFTYEALPNYNLVIQSSGSGSTTPSTGTYSHVEGSVVEIAASPALYHHFVGWTGNVPAGEETSNPLNVTMDGDRTITAVFAENVTTNSPFPVPEPWFAQYGITNNFEQAALDDDDDDGMSNWEEYVAGTDPTSQGSALNLTSIELGDGSTMLSFMSRDGRLYTIEATLDVTGGEWTVVESNIPGIEATISVIDSILPNVQFYRLKVQLQGDVP